MAKKQNKNAKTKQKTNQVTNQKPKPKGNTAVNVAKTSKAPSKNELVFFRVGVSVIAIGLIVAVIVMIVNNYMSKEDVDPYEDYNHLETEELVAITKYVNSTTYGDLDFFVGKSKYDDLRVILNKYDVFYFYFYHSESINKDILAEIEKLENVEKLPLLFIDLDDIGNIALFEETDLTHLNLVATADYMLLTYDMSPATVDDFFKLETSVSNIVTELGKI